ncbi:MAG: hypothetical protein DMG40_25390 [Acidobacteria bacterium]|nr:MAG: hypothetical protein DMG40_25390 [Acidobacteriota bacterium]
MRKITLLLPLALAVSASAQTAKKTPVGQTSATVQALIALENKRVDALQKADTSTLDFILANTYVDTSEDGQRSDKQAIFSVLKSGDLKFESVKVSDMQVHAYGAATVVTGTGVQRGTFKGRPLTPQIIFTDTFIRQNGDWRAVASHRSAAPGDTGPSAISVQERTKGTAPEGTEQIVVELEKRGWQAAVDRDSRADAALLADDFQNVAEYGVWDKSRFAQTVSDPNYTLKSFSMSEVRFSRLAPTVVLLTYNATQVGTDHGKPVPSPVYISSVWVNRNGKWLNALFQDTRQLSPGNEAEIRALYDRWAQAFEARDIDGIMSVYAPGDAIVAYDVVPPLQYKGKDTYRKDYLEFLAQYDGAIHVEYRDMRILSDGDVGLIHALERFTGKLRNGQQSDIWLRVTSGLRKIDGKWLIVHDHVSVPVDFETGKAALELKP